METIQNAKQINDELINNNQPFEFIVTSNITDKGILKVKDVSMILIFDSKDYKIMNGYYSHGYIDYALPIINGKAMRVKNKTMRITKYHIDVMTGMERWGYCKYLIKGDEKLVKCLRVDEFEII